MAKLNLRKRGSKWEYRFQIGIIDGKRKYETKSGFRTKKDAEQAGNLAMTEYNLTGKVIKEKEISFSDYIDLWMKLYCKANTKDTSIQGYEKKIRLYIKPALGHYPLKSLTASILQEFINKLFNDGMSRATLSNIKGILSNSLSYAVQPLEYIHNSPMVHVTLPKKGAVPENPTKNSPHFYIPNSDIDKILERFPEGSSAHLPLILGYKCGLRLGEAYGITWDNIDFENSKLTVNKQIQWHEKSKKDKTDTSYWYITAPKYNEIRTIDIDKQLITLLKNIKKQQEKHKKEYDDLYVKNYVSKNKQIINNTGDGTEFDFVCIRECGELIKPGTMQHTSKVIHELGIDFTFHSLRHTHCTMLLEAGADVKYVQKRLGHKNVKVTMQTYLHLTESMSKKGCDILNSMY